MSVAKSQVDICNLFVISFPGKWNEYPYVGSTNSVGILCGAPDKIRLNLFILINTYLHMQELHSGTSSLLTIP